MVDRSCVFLSQKRSSMIVNSSVKRRSAMNMGTFSPAVPAGEEDEGFPVAVGRRLTAQPPKPARAAVPRQQQRAPMSPQTTLSTLTMARGAKVPSSSRDTVGRAMM